MIIKIGKTFREPDPVTGIVYDDARAFWLFKNQVRYLGRKVQWVIGKHQIAFWTNPFSGKPPVFSLHPVSYPNSTAKTTAKKWL